MEKISYDAPSTVVYGVFGSETGFAKVVLCTVVFSLSQALTEGR